MKLDLHAANRSPIHVNGAIILHLQEMPPRDNKQSCNTMVYVGISVHGFYLSLEAMLELGMLPPSFPSVGATVLPLQGPRSMKAQRPPKDQRAVNTGCSSLSAASSVPCSCPARTVVPDRPSVMPFECTPTNNAAIEQWLLQHFASSTFNTCPRRPLPYMSGPPAEIHLMDDATQKAVHTLASVPIHWQEQQQRDLL